MFPPKTGDVAEAIDGSIFFVWRSRTLHLSLMLSPVAYPTTDMYPSVPSHFSHAVLGHSFHGSLLAFLPCSLLCTLFTALPHHLKLLCTFHPSRGLSVALGHRYPTLRLSGDVVEAIDGSNIIGDLI